MSQVVKETHCKTCLHVLDRVSAVGDKDQGACEGAISVCIYCGVISFFDADLNLREATPEEIEEIRIKYPLSYWQLTEIKRFILKRNQRN